MWELLGSLGWDVGHQAEKQVFILIMTGGQRQCRWGDVRDGEFEDQPDNDEDDNDNDEDDNDNDEDDNDNDEED